LKGLGIKSPRHEAKQEDAEASIVMGKAVTEKKLEHFLARRPEKEDLVGKHILADVKTSPGLADAANKLEKEKKKNFLTKFLSNRLENQVRSSTKSVFGLPLHQFQAQARFVPHVVNDCISFIRHPNNITQEGIFRIPGSKQAIEAVKALYKGVEDRHNLQAVESCTVHVAADVLKQFFAQLPEPLLTHNLYDPMMAVYDKAGDSDHPYCDDIKSLLATVPPFNKLVFAVLMSFLKDVNEHSEKNKMHSSNLGLIFGPSLLKPLVSTNFTLMDLRRCEITSYIIDHYKCIVLVS